MLGYQAWATETFTHLGTHSSTHMDAPPHDNSVIQDRPVRSIGPLPLEWFYAPGVMLDFRHKAGGGAVTQSDTMTELAQVNHPPHPLDIVLINTGRDPFYEQPDSLFRGPGVAPDATRWLVAQGVRVIGIGAWG